MGTLFQSPRMVRRIQRIRFLIVGSATSWPQLFEMTGARKLFIQNIVSTTNLTTRSSFRRSGRSATSDPRLRNLTVKKRVLRIRFLTYGTTAAQSRKFEMTVNKNVSLSK